MALGSSKICNSSQDVLLITLEFLNSPHNSWLIRFILTFSSSSRENLDLGRVVWNRNLHNHIVPDVGIFINGSDFDRIFDSLFFKEFLNDRCYFEWQIDIWWYSVRHNFKKSIRWDESNGSVSIKSLKTDALMEFDVINLNAFLLLFLTISSCWIIRFSYQQFIINSEFALWHTWKLGFDNNLSNNIRFQNCASIWNQNINVFNNVNEQLIVSVLDSFGSPWLFSCGLDGNLF